ncbi:MAG: hypothetical protein PHW69_04765 [Elusimicrobiaceae bacterium]|nr:hypothetical protein [Elusimicrobiaceae bacterium]
MESDAGKDAGVISGTLRHVMRYTENIHDSVSKNFLRTVGRVDDYFGNRYYVKTRQKSAAVLTLDTYIKEGSLAFRPNINAKIDLPGTQDRFNVIVTHIQEETLDRMSAMERVRNSQDYFAQAFNRTGNSAGSDNNSTTFVGLRYARQLTKHLANHVDLGLNYNFLPRPWVLPKPYGSYNLDLTHDIKNFLIRQDNKLFWEMGSDAGYSGALVLTRQLAQNLLLESEFDGNRTFVKPNWTMLETVSLNWIASDRDIITPMFQATMNSTPAFIATMYTVAVNWRRRLHNDWLFFGAAPEIDYPRDHAFGPQYRLTLSLEVIFGFAG